jgi:hypothetical protein
MLDSTWPDGVDLASTLAFLALALLAPALGYVFMVADYRAYVRSLRRALVRVAGVARDPFAAWAERETPACLAAFGLARGCSEDELLEAYRTRVKMLHPDRGGDQRRFLILQRQFEQASRYIQRER